MQAYLALTTVSAYAPLCSSLVLFHKVILSPCFEGGLLTSGRDWRRPGCLANNNLACHLTSLCTLVGKMLLSVCSNHWVGNPGLVVCLAMPVL